MSRKIDTDAVIYAVRFDEQAGDPAQPAAGYWLIYFKAGGVYIEDSAGNVTGPLSTGGGGGATVLEVQVFS